MSIYVVFDKSLDVPVVAFREREKAVEFCKRKNDFYESDHFVYYRVSISEGKNKNKWPTY